MAVAEKKTAFDSAVHGFHFRNRFAGPDILDELRSGFGDLARIAPIPDTFWDRWGLCGGMAWHALDRFYARNPVPVTRVVPGADSGLFRVLVARQLDSFRGWDLVTRCLDWQTRSDEQTWWRIRRSIGHVTQKIEWPKVRQAIDAGYPASLCLLRATTNPGENHQVLAIAYRHDDGNGRVEIELYDPNHPDGRPHIGFVLGRPQSRLEASQSSGENLRGFFAWPYDRTRRLIA